MSQRDVEKNLNLKNPTVTGILKRLDEKGYIFCVPNANDRRKKDNLSYGKKLMILEEKWKLTGASWTEN